MDCSAALDRLSLLAVHRMHRVCCKHIQHRLAGWSGVYTILGDGHRAISMNARYHAPAYLGLTSLSVIAVKHPSGGFHVEIAGGQLREP